MKKKKSKKTIKDLHLDKPTSHGGWPSGKPGGYTDPDTPVYKQIANYLQSMGLIDDDNPRARLAETSMQSNMYAPLSLKDPINKAINAMVKSVKLTNSAEKLHNQSLQIIMLLSQVIPMQAPISEKQSWYLSSAILRYHSRMIQYKESVKDDFENNKYKTGNYSMNFFDSPDIDKWREIDAKQLQFHREVESMVGPIEHQGMPDYHHQVVFAGDIDSLKARFVSAGLAKENDGTFVGRYGQPPGDSDKYSLYSNVFFYDDERYFTVENKIRDLIREVLNSVISSDNY